MGKQLRTTAYPYFGTGAGDPISGYWDTDLDGNSQEYIPGPNKFRWFSDIMCGPSWAENPFDHTGVLSISEYSICMLDTGEILSPGTYFIDPDHDKFVLISEKSGGVTWSSRAGLYFMLVFPGQGDEKVIAFQATGAPAELPFAGITSIPNISPDLTTWQWADDKNLYIGLSDGSESRIPILEDADSVDYQWDIDVYWQPESNDMIICSPSGVYVAFSPDYVPAFLIDGYCPTSVIWP
jgi:hypothetical protein